MTIADIDKRLAELAEHEDSANDVHATPSIKCLNCETTRALKALRAVLVLCDKALESHAEVAGNPCDKGGNGYFEPVCSGDIRAAINTPFEGEK